MKAYVYLGQRPVGTPPQRGVVTGHDDRTGDKSTDGVSYEARIESSGACTMMASLTIAQNGEVLKLSSNGTT